VFARFGAKQIPTEEKVMNKSLASVLHKATIAACTLGALAGCGDAHVFKLDPGDIDPDSAGSLAAGIDGADVELRRYSTGCHAAASEPLTAKVSDGTEFTADQVKSLAAPCPESPNPGVEVQVERRSLIFDFSNVEQPGRFPASEFEGYILDISRGQNAPLLVYAVIDHKLSNVDIDNEALSYDHDFLEVNFTGTRYDSTTFVKIDLFFIETARID
jgi:hypothetical protein